MSLDRTNLFEGQGDFFLAARNSSGVPGPRWFLGEAPAISIEQEEEVETVKETSTGTKGTLARIGKGLTLKLKMTIRDIKQKNRLLTNRGTALSISSGSVSAEAMPTMAVGDYYVTKNPGVSSLVITDSAGTPGTLTLGTHYEVIDADQGIIKILSLGSFTQPFLCAYTKAATTGHTAHTDTSGAPAYNMALSLRRANAVKDALVREGVPATAIAVVGRGEQGLLVQTGPNVREPQNRRVEIVIQ